MIGIIGKKLGMTQIFNEQGQQIPVTVIEAEPNPVLAVTDKEKDGHASIQLGLGTQRLRRDSARGEVKKPKGRRATLAEVGHAKKAGLEAPPAVLRSIRLDEPGNAKIEIPKYSVGDLVKVDVFKVGETVKVTGTSKGRGFQGIVKRHKAGGGPNTHGNTKHRRPGSIGPGTDPMTAAVVHFDPDLDVAALRVDRSLGTAADLAIGPVGRDAPAILGVTGEPSAGRVVAATRAVTVLRQVTIETTDITRSHEVSRPGFELAGAVEPGDSGAMVHTADGGIGIVWARSTRDADRAWVVALPDVLVDPDERTELVEPVDSGSCP